MSLAPAAPIQSLSEKSSTPGSSTPVATEPGNSTMDPGKTDPKSKKRGLFGFNKKKADDSNSKAASEPSADPSLSLAQDVSQASSRKSTSSPVLIDAPNVVPSSPSRGGYSSSRFGSPNGSQIFERDVQESAILPNSPAIPSHIQTENYIPSVLDASSEAITDDHLNTDTIEIITHTSHQPAAAAVTGASFPASQDSLANSWAEDLAAFSDREEAASNYGSLDSADVRRLSFISFADVVQSEHGGIGGPAGSRDSMHLAGLTSLASLSANRSPSPIRSPVSSQGPETSPPNSKSGSVKGVSMSPGRRALASPIPTEHSLGGGEFNIETMTQALRRTGSTDLSGARGSIPVSPIEGPSR